MASNDRVTFREALAILDRIPERELWSPFDVKECADSLDLARAINDKRAREGKPAQPYCRMCGWPKGTPGFVRLPFPTWHELFGRAWPCPRCNGGGRTR